MTLDLFGDRLRDLISQAPQDLPDQMLTALQQALDWLDNGPCEHCDSYHPDGSC